MKEIIYTKNAPEPIGPYSQAIKVDSTVYVSGQIPLDPKSGHIVSNKVEEQTHQVISNLKSVLAAAGLTLEDVVKTSIFLTDLSQFGTVNEIYGSYFASSAPARETVEVKALPKGSQVEISCVAVG